jgi:hypothetical protein
MYAPVEFSTLYLFKFIKNSVDVLSCPVLSCRPGSGADMYDTL